MLSPEGRASKSAWACLQTTTHGTQVKVTIASISFFSVVGYQLSSRPLEVGAFDKTANSMLVKYVVLL